MLSIQSIIDILSSYQPIELPETPGTAAVMILFLITESNEIEIVLTKRAAHLSTYAGDYSFPGGVQDPEDKILLVTAMRELHEELNITKDLYQVIGQLDDFMNHYGNMVRPFVGFMSRDLFEQHYKICFNEIAEIYYFPLTSLKELQDNPELHNITRRRPSYSFTQENVFVWGLTATILVHLENVLMNGNKSLGKRIL